MNALPVASTNEVRAHARRIALRYPRDLAGVLALNALAAASGLAVPWLLGDLVASVTRGRNDIAHYILLICVACVAQATLIRFAMYAAAGLGEKVLAELRQEFVRNMLALDLNTVENTDRGDLVTRTTRDVDTLSTTVRHAIPETLIAVLTIAISLGALILISPLLVLPCLVSVPILVAASKWYLARARAGYVRQSASYSQLTESLTETVEGAHTVEALRLTPRRLERVNRDIGESYAAERYTLRLRNVFLPICDTTYILPVATTLIVGGLFYIHGMVTLAAVTAATLYIQQLLGPVDTLLFWLNELQMSGVALARLLGISESAPPTAPAAGEPVPYTAGNGNRLAIRDVRYAYRPAVDVLHGIDLDVIPGERLAVVGPSGSGKSTLGQLLAGIHRPRTGSITFGGLSLAEMPLEELRGRVGIVAQDHHVFDGSLRDNLVIAKSDATDEEIEAALTAVDAWRWAAPFGLNTRISLHGNTLTPTPAQTQQVALARLVLANPHTLILDEATALLNPHAARQVERSLAAVLADRTVIAIAHRLHTAHDADRIAVMEEGRISELGTHHELLERGGTYAHLWKSWQGRPESPSPTDVHSI